MNVNKALVRIYSPVLKSSCTSQHIFFLSLSRSVVLLRFAGCLRCTRLHRMDTNVPMCVSQCTFCVCVCVFLDSFLMNIKANSDFNGGDPVCALIQHHLGTSAVKSHEQLFCSSAQSAISCSFLQFFLLSWNVLLLFFFCRLCAVVTHNIHL